MGARGCTNVERFVSRSMRVWPIPLHAVRSSDACRLTFDRDANERRNGRNHERHTDPTRRGRNRLRRPHHRRLLRPPRPPRRVRRHRRDKVDAAQRRADPDRRGRPRGLRRRGGRAAGNLRVRARRRTPRPRADIVFLCVPTPQGEDGSRRPQLRRAGRRADRSACSSPGAVVVNKSTVPVGSTHGRRARARPPDVQRRLEPRVPPRGHRRPRLPPPRPCRHRRRDDRAAADRVADAVREHRHRRSSSPTRRRPRPSSTPPTASWR